MKNGLRNLASIGLLIVSSGASAASAKFDISKLEGDYVVTACDDSAETTIKTIAFRKLSDDSLEVKMNSGSTGSDEGVFDRIDGGESKLKHKEDGHIRVRTYKNSTLENGIQIKYAETQFFLIVLDRYTRETDKYMLDGGVLVRDREVSSFYQGTAPRHSRLVCRYLKR